MFTTYDHDPPDNDDIKLCAGPKERQALVTVLRQQTDLLNIQEFVDELHARAQEQSANINIVNDAVGEDLLHEEDAGVDFNQHLSRMCQEDVTKVRRHLHVLFIDSCDIYTDVRALDQYLPDDEREDIFKNIITPWLNWVRSASQNKSTTEVSAEYDTEVSDKSDKHDTEVSDKSAEQSETALSDVDIVTSTDKKSSATKDNNNTNKKPSNNRKYTMFSKFEHDPPDSEDITLCAGPKELQALAAVLGPQLGLSDIEDFIEELHDALDEQTISILEINENFASDVLYEDDAAISFNRHLSDMSQEDVDKVMRHMRVIFIERCSDCTGVTELDDIIPNEERTDIYNNIIEPWLKWVRSAKKNKSNNKKSNTTKNKKSSNNNDNMNNKNINTTPATVNMFESLTATFANMLGTLEPDMVRMTFNGNVAVKTTKGYKTYDVAKKKAVNMDSLVMPDMSAFLLLPSTKVNSGDIILRDGTFYSIISVDNTTNELVGYNYESGKKETLVKETHCFLGNTYFYSKLVSPVLSFFGGKPKPGDKKEEGSKDAEDTEAYEDSMSMLLPLAMMSQNGDMNSMLPMLLMSKMDGKEDSGMLKMLMLSGMLGGGNSNMNNMLPLMLLNGNFPSI